MVLKVNLSDDQLKADIINRLLRRHCWGAKYLPVDTLVRWLSKKIKKNGKRVERIIKQLVNEGFLIPHKRGETVSLNPAKSRDVIEFIRRYMQ